MVHLIIIMVITVIAALCVYKSC